MTARRTAIGSLAAAAIAILLQAGTLFGQQGLDLPPRGVSDPQLEFCGTGRDRLRQLGLVRTLAPVLPGHPFSYHQDPPILGRDVARALRGGRRPGSPLQAGLRRK
jgi:hypothetical protein